MKQTNNGATAPNGSGLPKKPRTPEEILTASIKDVWFSRNLDDLIMAACIAKGRMDALLYSGLIGSKAYRHSCAEIVGAAQAVRQVLEDADEQS